MPKAPVDKLYKIGVIAKKTGFSVQALRYYQQRGLISPKQVLSSGYRLYDENVMVRLQFIQRCQDIDFTLDEILELLALQDNPASNAFSVKTKVDIKITLISKKIEALQKLQLSLHQLSASCDGKGSVDQCPIISKLRH